jgi:hypothetical protein
MKSFRFVPLRAVSLFILMLGGACASQESRRPFEIGPAIRQMCEGPGMPAAFCPELDSFVAALRAESRDTSWAAEMESRIENYLHAMLGKEADIRSLECRATLCAAEYATTIPIGEDPVDDAETLLGPLEPESGGIGYEMANKDQPAKVVCVLGFKRRA